jgi:hypothetical protein
MNRVLEEAIHAARQAPLMYFGPLIAAGREVSRIARLVQRSNRRRTAGRGRHMSDHAD